MLFQNQLLLTNFQMPTKRRPALTLWPNNKAKLHNPSEERSTPAGSFPQDPKQVAWEEPKRLIYKESSSIEEVSRMQD